MSRVTCLNELLQSVALRYFVDAAGSLTDFVQGLAIHFSLDFCCLRMRGDGVVPFVTGGLLKEVPDFSADVIDHAVSRCDEIVTMLFSADTDLSWQGILPGEFLSSVSEQWEVFPLWNRLGGDRRLAGPYMLTLSGYCMMSTTSGAPITADERHHLAGTFQALHSMIRSQSVLGDARTGFYRFESFRHLIDQSLTGLVVGAGQCHVMVMSLDNMTEGSSVSHLSKREDHLRLVWQVLCEHFQSLPLMAVDVHDHLYVCAPGSDRGALIKEAMAVRDALREEPLTATFVQNCRIGLSIWPEHGLRAAELIHRARQALTCAFRETDGDLVIFNRERMMLLQVNGGFPWTDNDLLNYHHTRLLLESIEALRLTSQPEDLEQFIVDKAIEVTGAERGVLLLVDEEDKLVFRRGRLVGQRNLENMPDISWSIPRRVLESGEASCYVTMDHDVGVIPGQSIQQLQLLSVMCSPLKNKQQMIGLLYVDSKKSRLEFAEADVAFFEALAKQLSVTLEVAQLFSDNTDKQMEIAQLNARLKEKLEEQTIRLIDMEKEIASNRSLVTQQFAYGNMIGASPQIKDVFSLIDRIAPYSYPVLIEGESGTGKELVARAIHVNSPRNKGRFISENCGAIPDTLFEAELFGHAKGAFTGADHEKLGLIRAAEGGTLFLDEIANMSEAMQKGILRVIQEQEVRPVGGKISAKVDVRIICSSNIPLMDLVNEGKFRKDLFYRLNVIAIRLPPLRERKEDIPLLVKHFLEKTAKQTGGQTKKVHPDLMEPMLAYNWPGNVRELENEVRRIYILSDDVVSAVYLSPHITNVRSVPDFTPGDDDARLSIRDRERMIIVEALRSTEGNKKRAAEQLGISRTNLYQKLALYDIVSRRDY